MKLTVIREIASAVQAWKNCKATNNSWADNWDERLDWLESNALPSGSGFDSGTKIDCERTKGDVVVLTTSYHHMNDNGYYCGWTKHVITVRPTFDGISIKISGRDRNQFKDYAYQTFEQSLSEEVIPQADNTYRFPERERMYAEYQARLQEDHAQ
jgi:hypothetical protein